MLYGNFGDPLYNVWLFAKLVSNNLVIAFGFHNPDPSHILLPTQPLIDWQGKIFAWLFGPIAAYNIIIILGFILTPIAVYMLSQKFIKDKWVSVIVALTVTLLPYHVVHSQYHISLSSIYWLIFFVYFLICLWEKPDLKYFALTGLFAGLTILDNFQYGAFALITAAVFIFIALVRDLITRKTIKNIRFYLLTLGASVLAGIVLFTFDSEFVKSVLRGSDLTNLGPKRSLEELSAYSAQWFYYIKPSGFLRFFSLNFINQYNQKLISLGTTPEEQAIFLGWIPLVFAAISLFIKKNSKKTLYVFLIILALLTLSLSFAPTINIFGHVFTSLSKILYDHYPVVRVYARFGLVVGLCVAVLMGIGIEGVFTKFKYKKIFYAVLVLLILVEFLPKNPLPFYKTSNVSPVYAELAKLAPGPVAEYPVFPADEPQGYSYLVAQLSHHFPLVYGYTIGSEGDTFRKTILDPSNPATVSRLATMNVKYIITHQDLAKLLATKYPAETNYGYIRTPDSQNTELITCVDNECLYRIKI